MYKMIADLRPSPLKMKRYRATILKQNGEKQYIDFGLKDGSTYIDGNRTDKERENYIARHLANKREKYLIENLIISPALLSMKLLWGSYTSLQKNVDELNKMFKLKQLNK